VVLADAATLDDLAGVFERATDRLTAWYLTDADVAIGVVEDHHVSGEVRRMGAAQVQQHAVASSDGNHPHDGHDGGATLSGRAKRRGR
jgi:hypothetical protein